jgi:hypothetical protein
LTSFFTENNLHYVITISQASSHGLSQSTINWDAANHLYQPRALPTDRKGEDGPGEDRTLNGGISTN